jgi:hypothetical protein
LATVLGTPDLKAVKRLAQRRGKAIQGIYDQFRKSVPLAKPGAHADKWPKGNAVAPWNQIRFQDTVL